ncbi:hypothetical protein GYMLUDRAFT_246431 [Collybiopsis luxurians FD-317 M1]|uniref:DUF6534 domain-containing protein n=1 Tax=Collybiopsis luxurians FD-317 M1 TaxID=944289 RepID=A0A0D0C6E5_9AGAR|nr:hypothetical protein GYMLUDRAFT_246431 [Collybiopsis luxurians FD-317 M1]
MNGLKFGYVPAYLKEGSRLDDWLPSFPTRVAPIQRSLSTPRPVYFMAASSTPDSTVQKNVGPVVVAVMVNTFLYGLCFLQFIWYFTSGAQDRISMKIFILWELLVDTCHSAVAIYLLWLFAVDNFMNEAFLKTAPWPPSSICLFTAWVVSTPQWLSVKASSSWPALTTTTDVAISASLVFYLRKSRTYSRQTDHVIASLVREAVETTASASFFSVRRGNAMRKGTEQNEGYASHLLYFMARFNDGLDFFPLARVYTNSFLAILNSRESLRRELHKPILSPIPKDATVNAATILTQSLSSSTGDRAYSQTGESKGAATTSASAGVLHTRTTLDSSMVWTDLESLETSQHCDSLIKPGSSMDSMVWSRTAPDASRLKESLIAYS